LSRGLGDVYKRQAGQQPSLQEHTQPVFMSNTIISYASTESPSPTPSAILVKPSGSNSADQAAVIIIVSGVAGGLLIAFITVLILYYICSVRSKTNRVLKVA
jgi:hypothetical protein